MHGEFTAAPGVEVAGTSEGSILTNYGTAPALTLETGAASESRLHSLRIESLGTAGVVVRGSGLATIEDVFVRAEKGTGIAAFAVLALTLREVTVEGPIDALNVLSLSSSATSMDTATHGIFLSASAATFEQVTARGFADFGVLAVDSQLAWDGGNFSANRSVGAMIYGGSATLSNVRADEVWRGTRVIPAFGLAAAGNAEVESSALSIHNTEGAGIFHSSSIGRHLDVDVTDNTHAGIWTQFSSMFEVSGSLANNSLAGVVAVDTELMLLHDANIEDTQLSIRLVGETGTTRIGDGVQLNGMVLEARFENVQLVENSRVGLLIDVPAAAMPMFSFVNVTSNVAAATQGATGVVAQGSPLPAGWDNGIVRSGTTEASDHAAGGTSCVNDSGCTLPGQRCRSFTCAYDLVELRTESPASGTYCANTPDCGGTGQCMGNVCIGGPCDFPRPEMPPL